MENPLSRGGHTHTFEDHAHALWKKQWCPLLKLMVTRCRHPWSQMTFFKTKTIEHACFVQSCSQHNAVGACYHVLAVSLVMMIQVP